MSFHHAVVTKGLMIGCAVTSVVASIFDVKHSLHLQLVPHLSRYHQYWRLLVHHLAFSNSSDLLIAELLLYNVSIPMERIFGSVKFASSAVVSVLTATILEFTALVILNRFGLNVLPSGPIPLVFSILYQYSRLIPPAYSFKVFGVTVSNKIFVYILALQLVIAQPPGSIASSIIGALAGQFYLSDIFGLKSFRVPRMMQQLASRYIVPLLGSTRPPRRTNRAVPDDLFSSRRPTRSEENEEVVTTTPTPATNTRSEQEETVATDRLPGQSVMREWVNELTGSAEGNTPGLRAPRESEISQLMNMFPDLRREDIVGALQRSANVEAAVDTLLSTQS